MKKEELQEAIEEGVSNAIWKPIFNVLTVIAVILLLFLIIGFYQEWKNPTDNVSVMEEIPCNYQTLYCSVIDKETEMKQIENRLQGNTWKGESKYIYFSDYHQICGWEEAQAWFEIYENKVGGDLYLECH